jgi:lactate dehydrogenase-like 2-hydroxyacid dehydrogenase
MQEQDARNDDQARARKVLIADLVGLQFDAQGRPDHSEVAAHVEANGGIFHEGALDPTTILDTRSVHFFYQPHLSIEADILSQTDKGQYDALIAAATFIPKSAVFPLGGVRIGAGTGNMGSASWGGGNGEGGEAPLMNTPGINSRATAQMVMKAILKVLPDLPVELLHRRVTEGHFDTGRDLKDYPTAKLEGQKIAILGYGNIGREVAKLARAFGMHVAVYAREKHRNWIEAEGFGYAASPLLAAAGADVLSVHIGLGRLDSQTGRYSNAGAIDDDVLSAMNSGAVLVNYDRGEVVDVAALDRALSTGQLRHAAIDADLFRDANTGALSGPMLPYLSLMERHAAKLELLPHAAADTDHPSRVAGAKQAVDQILDVIRFRRVTNLKGDLPDGYVSVGARVPKGIGRVTGDKLAEAMGNKALFGDLLLVSRRITDTLDSLAVAGSPAAGVTAGLARDLLRQRLLIDQLGLDGPGED